jgi:hypothetical protein
MKAEIYVGLGGIFLIVGYLAIIARINIWPLWFLVAILLLLKAAAEIIKGWKE